METINLCLITPEFLPIWGGTASYVIELSKNLPKEVEIHVVTLKREFPGMCKFDSKCDPASIFNRNVNIHYISKGTETFFYNLGFQIACLRKIPQLYKEYGFDILHSQFGHMSDAFLQLFRKIPIPVVTTVHGTIRLVKEISSMSCTRFSEMEWSEKQLIIYYPFLRTLERIYAKYMSKFIAVSDAVKNRIIKDLNVDPGKISRVFNGVDTDLFCMRNNHEMEKKYSKPTVVFMGRMMSKKGIHVLIKAIPQILLEEPETHFFFIGGGNISFYVEMTRKMGIPKTNFSFIGHADYFARSRFLREATVCVNPSFYECFSLSILEAMSSGTAVVASDVGGNPEMIKSGKNGILIPPCNSKILAKSIVSLLENENLNKRIGNEARRTVEKSFSSKKCASETYNIYKKTIS